MGGGGWGVLSVVTITVVKDLTSIPYTSPGR